VAFDGVAPDDQSLDEQVRAAEEDLAILEGPRLSLVGVDHQVLGEAGFLADEVPLHPGGEARAAAPAQVGLDHFVDDLLRLHLQRLRQRLVSPPWRYVSSDQPDGLSSPW